MDDLKLIKKHYGEAMMHLCRELFPSLLEQNGLLLNLIEMHFPHSKELYNDIVENDLICKFKSYIYGLTTIKNEEINVNLSPK